MLAVELHSQSSRSYDGHDPVKKLLEGVRDAGLDALAVADHDAIRAGETTVEDRRTSFRITLRQAYESATRRVQQQIF